MKLVVGLGNVGRKYVGTRHNVGFEVLAELARKYGTARPKEDFDGEVVPADFNGVRAVLLCPHTLMNRSGISVVKARDFYKLGNEDLLVVCDDLNLPLGKLRFRAKGSSGGQKGMADVIRHLGTEEFPRLRIGIGQPPAGWDAVGFVLGKFAKQELPEIEPAIVRSAEATVAWASHGIAHCMNVYNADKAT
jgi:PTH1 family peptidyl-tRNA hydrolase